MRPGRLVERELLELRDAEPEPEVVAEPEVASAPVDVPEGFVLIKNPANGNVGSCHPDAVDGWKSLGWTVTDSQGG